MSKIKVIIPAAGYGTRMNMKPNESKEMLLDSNGKPIIEYILRMSEQLGYESLVITRKEKTDLITYAEYRNAQVQIIEPEGQMFDTVLKSEPNWNRHNILVMPDTRFGPSKFALMDIAQSLKLGCCMAVATHEVEDSQNWCVVDSYCLIEKPKNSKSTTAMGVMGFSNDNRWAIDGLTYPNTPVQLYNTGFVMLDWFRDLTRTGRIEE